MTKKQTALGSPWVRFWIGLLLVFVAMNVVMIYLAVGTGPGLVVEDYYDRGKNHEKNVLKKMAQDPGWKMEFQAPKFIDVGKPVRIAFRLTDREGRPLGADAVTLYAYRSSDAKQDFSLPMKPVEPGLYEATATFPLLGVWDLVASCKLGTEEHNSKEYRFSAGVK